MKVNWSKIRQGVQEVGAEAKRQLTQDAQLIRTEVAQVDWNKVGADLEDAGAQAKDLAENSVARTRSFIADARAAWSAHGKDEPTMAAQAVEQIAQAVDPAVAQSILRNMPPEDLEAGLHEVSQRWTAELGEAGAQAKLAGLQAQLDAMQVVGKAHDQRARSVPRHKGRPDGVQAGLLKAVGALKGAVEAVRAQLPQTEWPDVYAVTSGASESLWAGGEKIAKSAASWAGEGGGGQGVSDTVAQARQRLGDAIDGASPQWLKARYQAAKASIGEATQQAETVLNGLDGLELEAGDRDAMFNRLMTTLEHAKHAMDPDADAVGVGYLKEAAGGASGGRGKELVYVRETGELRVVDLKMSGARLAIGASKRPFARSLYGKAEAIKTTERRNTGEVGAMIFHVGSSTSHTEAGEDTVKSWHGTLGIGFNASLPLVGDQSLYSVQESSLAVHKLSEAQQAQLEAQLDQVPTSSRGWTSIVRDAVGHTPQREG